MYTQNVTCFSCIHRAIHVSRVYTERYSFLVYTQSVTCFCFFVCYVFLILMLIISLVVILSRGNNTNLNNRVLMSDKHVRSINDCMMCESKFHKYLCFYLWLIQLNYSNGTNLGTDGHFSANC